LTEHDDVIKSLLRGAPRLGLALGLASVRAGPAYDANKSIGMAQNLLVGLGEESLFFTAFAVNRERR